MSDFPDITKPSKIGRSQIKPVEVVISSAGYPLSSARATASKYEFKLNWNRMPHAELDTLESHADSNAGSAFSWTNPVTGVTHFVIYIPDNEGKLVTSNFDATRPNYSSVAVTFREQ